MDSEYFSQITAYLQQQQQQQQQQQLYQQQQQQQQQLAFAQLSPTMNPSFASQVPGLPNHSFPSGLIALDTMSTQQNGSLFIGDLSYFCTEEDISALFAPFGPILTIRIRRSENGVPLMYGSVVLANEEKAKAAVNAFNAKEFMGRNMK